MAGMSDIRIVANQIIKENLVIINQLPGSGQEAAKEAILDAVQLSSTISRRRNLSLLNGNGSTTPPQDVLPNSFLPTVNGCVEKLVDAGVSSEEADRIAKISVTSGFTLHASKTALCMTDRSRT